jgi:hypothetical protein
MTAAVNITGVVDPRLVEIRTRSGALIDGVERLEVVVDAETPELTRVVLTLSPIAVAMNLKAREARLDIGVVMKELLVQRGVDVEQFVRDLEAKLS